MSPYKIISPEDQIRIPTLSYTWIVVPRLFSRIDIWQNLVLGRYISVSLATRYGLNGSGDRIPVGRGGGGRNFPTCPHRPWGPPSLLYSGYRVIPKGKAAVAWRGVEYPPPSSAKVKECVKMYVYSPHGPSLPVLGWTLLLPCHNLATSQILSLDKLILIFMRSLLAFWLSRVC
jgi:hypothetical protein